MIITTKPDKVRGAFEPISFEIDKHRNVRQLDQVVPTFEHRNTLSEIKKHKDVVKAIDSAIDSGAESQKQITEYCQNQFSMSDYSVRQVLKKYSIEINDDNVEQPRSHRDGLLWGRERTGQNNHLRYRRLSDELDLSDDEFNDSDSES